MLPSIRHGRHQCRESLRQALFFLQQLLRSHAGGIAAPCPLVWQQGERRACTQRRVRALRRRRDQGDRGLGPAHRSATAKQCQVDGEEADDSRGHSDDKEDEDDLGAHRLARSARRLGHWDFP